MLKYSNIEYAKESSFAKDRNIATKSQTRKKSQTSAGFAIDSQKGNIQKLKTPGKVKYDKEKINDFVDHEIDMSYGNENESPMNKNKQNHKILSRLSNPGLVIKEGESIVPPLALKNIGSSKNTQGTTGKLTRTTMHSTQIRDKMPLNNLKNNVNSGQSNHISNIDCKYKEIGFC